MPSALMFRAGRWVSAWESGFLAAPAVIATFCRDGDLINCRNQEFTGIHHDGGYAEVMIAKVSRLMSIPNELSSAAAVCGAHDV
jgi:D-arabinose 1-dehydrogenase-like Zn-dependent alcohol dehydrogenase